MKIEVAVFTPNNTFLADAEIPDQEWEQLNEIQRDERCRAEAVAYRDRIIETDYRYVNEEG